MKGLGLLGVVVLGLFILLAAAIVTGQLTFSSAIGLAMAAIKRLVGAIAYLFGVIQ